MIRVGRRAVRREHGGRRRLMASTLAVVLGISGLVTVASGIGLVADPVASPPPTVAAPPAETSVTVPDSPSRPVGGPVSVRIPTIGVDAPTKPLGLQPDGSVEVPTNFAHTGWYRHGPVPGKPGPAAILGHIDSHEGPAVFYRLSDLRPGDPVLVARDDGSTVTFRVDSIEQYPKDDFPTERVYGDTDHAALRLITCGGPFDEDARSYEDNIVVYARRDAA